ncbi:conserved protein of unknown function [Methylocaldum szegediense]|jgi:hypothetical protein|uniref:Uncharacterized protein n=1 Tax=Methylocaldum szegediense TaxID=73780 RepID=A0ABM9I633_9GAMM|nr:conserved protein of unknown function [Methylocaldum szegediense]
MTYLHFLVRYLIIPVVLTFFVLLVLVIETKPLVSPYQDPTHEYLARTRQLLSTTVQLPQNDNPARTIVLTANDLTAAANFAFLQKKLEGHAHCSIKGNRLKFVATLRLPIKSIPLFLNFRVIADDGEPHAVIKQVKLGRLALPRIVVKSLLNGFLSFTPLFRYSQVGDKLVKETRIINGRLQVLVNWNRDAWNQAKGLITDLADKERLLVYNEKLAEIINQSQLKRFMRLGPLMQHLFALAKSRSENNDDPIAENRALILVLSAYVNGKNITQWLPSNHPPVIPPRREVLLNRRTDIAQHFMASAALAMSGHSTLANMIGLAKEMNDTHSGSGFSFTDLAADQAGAMFGKTAIRSEDKARKVQAILSQSADESLFMPNIKDLPENLSPADFAARFKDIQSPEFNALKRQIEQRILACSLYQP